MDSSSWKVTKECSFGRPILGAVILSVNEGVHVIFIFSIILNIQLENEKLVS